MGKAKTFIDLEGRTEQSQAIWGELLRDEDFGGGGFDDGHFVGQLVDQLAVL